MTQLFDELISITISTIENMFMQTAQSTKEVFQSDEPPLFSRYHVGITLKGDEWNGQIVIGIPDSTCNRLTSVLLELLELDQLTEATKKTGLGEFANIVAGAFLECEDYKENYRPHNISTPLVLDQNFGEVPLFLKVPGSWTKLNIDDDPFYIFLVITENQSIKPIKPSSDLVAKQLTQNVILDPFIDGLLSTIHLYTELDTQLISHTMATDPISYGDLSSAIHFKGKAEGAVIIHWSLKAALLVTNEWLGLECTSITEDVNDCIAEYTNGMVGGAKKAFMESDFAFENNLPEVSNEPFVYNDFLKGIGRHSANFEVGGEKIILEVRIKSH